MRLLRPRDYLTFFMSYEEGKPYRAKKQAADTVLSLVLEVQRVTDEGFVTAAIDKDNYYPDTDNAYMKWPMEAGEEIVLLGSCDSYEPSNDASEDYGEARHAPGMLHVGRLVTFTRGSLRACDFLLQEVVVWDPADVEMTMFDTDPQIFRPAYHT